MTVKHSISRTFARVVQWANRQTLRRLEDKQLAVKNGYTIVQGATSHSHGFIHAEKVSLSPEEIRIQESIYRRKIDCLRRRMQDHAEKYNL